MISIYTDGACSNNQDRNNSIGGWAFVVVVDGVGISGNTGRVLKTTNNRMEIKAVIEGLKSVLVSKDKDITVYSDSQYIIETLKGNYRVKKNADLWEELFNITKQFSSLNYVKVRGHSNNEYNNLVDDMAVQETKGRY